MAGELLDNDDLQAPLILNKNFEPLLDTLNKIVKAAKEHSDVIGSAKTTTKLKDETAKLTAEQRELIKVQNQIASLTAKNNAEYKQAADALEKLKKELKLKNNEQEKDAKLINKTNSSIEELSKALDKNRKAYAQLRSEQARSTKEGKELLAVIQKQDREFKELSKSIGTVEPQTGGLEKFKGVVSDIGNKFVPQATEGLSAMGGLLSSSTLLVGGLATGAIMMGKAFVDESIRIRKNLTLVKKLTGETGLELENFTVRAGAVAKVFDKEFNEVARTGNVLVKEFGIESSEAFDTINQLLLRGVDIQGDFLEQVNEYSTFIKQAGGSTQDLVDILLASEKAGVFSDKGLDTVKEATIRIREMTPATRDAIKGIGLSVDAIQKGLATGTLSPLEVIKQITARMKELPPISTQVGTAIADIFGGAGEDAGQFLFQLGEITATQGEWTEQLTGSSKAQYDLLQATEDYEETLLSVSGNFNSFSINFQTFWTKVKTETLKILSDLSTAFTTMDERVGAFQQTIGQTTNIKALQTELQNLQKEFEETNSGDQTWRDGLSALFGGRTFLERRKELMEKINLTQERLNELKAEEATKDAEANKKIEDRVDNYNKLQKAAEKVQFTELQMRRKRAERDLNAGADRIAVTGLDLILEGEIANEIAVADAKKRIHEELMKFKRDTTIETNEGLYDWELLKLGEIQEAYNAFGNVVSTVVGSITESKLQGIEAQQVAVDEQLQRELALVGDNDEKRAAIEQRAAERQKKLEDEKARVQRKAAVFNKALAVGQAAIDAAGAILKALNTVPPASFALAAITAGLATAQTLAIAAAPIPAYEKGTSFHKGGIAQVGEGGSELVVTPQGNLMLTPNETSIMDLPRGSQVYTHDETLKALAMMGLRDSDYIGREKNVEFDIAKSFKSLEQTIKNKKETHYNWTRKGLERAFKYGESKQYFLDNFYK